MKAIGLIETKGLLTLIEATDAMVKSANVNILEKVHIGGGYVSIIVTGDVAAVKSAVDAGVSAVNRIDEKSLVSHHVIARPHCELESIIETTPAIERIEEESKREIYDEINIEDNHDEGSHDTENLPIEEVNEGNEKLEEDTLVNIAENPINEIVKNDQIEMVEIEKLDNKNTVKNLEGDFNRAQIESMIDEKGLNETIKILNRSRISKIRILMREYTEFELTNKAISKMDKRTLINKLKEKYKNK